MLQDIHNLLQKATGDGVPEYRLLIARNSNRNQNHEAHKQLQDCGTQASYQLSELSVSAATKDTNGGSPPPRKVQSTTRVAPVASHPGQAKRTHSDLSLSDEHGPNGGYPGSLQTLSSP
jgi:hypothetical protein